MPNPDDPMTIRDLYATMNRLDHLLAFMKTSTEPLPPIAIGSVEMTLELVTAMTVNYHDQCDTIRNSR